MKIPFVDLKTQYNSIKNEIIESITEVCESSSFILGEKVKKFERDFASLCGVKYAASCSSGTSALHLALLSLGIGKGDEVITVPNTFVATVEAIVHSGASPVLVDINPNTHNIDIDKIEPVITEKTKAVIPVHLYGQPADMDPILELAKKYNLYVIEDACQAHNAEYKTKKTGSIGDIGCFSFYPGKNLGGYGDGGCITTDNETLFEKIKLLRNHGSPEKYKHDMIGYNYRLSEIQGTVLSVKLKHLEEWTEARIKNSSIYTDLIIKNNIPVKTPVILEYVKPVFHLYVINTDDREALFEFLNNSGISVIMHYPIPIHLQPGFKFLGYKKGDFPVTEKDTEEILSLPMYPELKLEQIEYIIKKLQEFFK